MKTFESIDFQFPSSTTIKVTFLGGTYRTFIYDMSSQIPIKEYIKMKLTSEELSSIGIIEFTNTYNL